MSKNMDLPRRRRTPLKLLSPNTLEPSKRTTLKKSIIRVVSTPIGGTKSTTSQGGTVRSTGLNRSQTSEYQISKPKTAIKKKLCKKYNKCKTGRPIRKRTSDTNTARSCHAEILPSESDVEQQRKNQFHSLRVSRQLFPTFPNMQVCHCQQTHERKQDHLEHYDCHAEQFCSPCRCTQSENRVMVPCLTPEMCARYEEHGYLPCNFIHNMKEIPHSVSTSDIPNHTISRMPMKSPLLTIKSHTSHTTDPHATPLKINYDVNRNDGQIWDKSSRDCSTTAGTHTTVSLPTTSVQTIHMPTNSSPSTQAICESQATVVDSLTMASSTESASVSRTQASHTISKQTSQREAEVETSETSHTSPNTSISDLLTKTMHRVLQRTQSRRQPRTQLPRSPSPKRKVRSTRALTQTCERYSTEQEIEADLPGHEELRTQQTQNETSSNTAGTEANSQEFYPKVYKSAAQAVRDELANLLELQRAQENFDGVPTDVEAQSRVHSNISHNSSEPTQRPTDKSADEVRLTQQHSVAPILRALAQSSTQSSSEADLSHSHPTSKSSTIETDSSHRRPTSRSSAVKVNSSCQTPVHTSSVQDNDSPSAKCDAATQTEIHHRTLHNITGCNWNENDSRSRPPFALRTFPNVQSSNKFVSRSIEKNTKSKVPQRIPPRNVVQPDILTRRLERLKARYQVTSTQSHTTSTSVLANKSTDPSTQQSNIGSNMYSPLQTLTDKSSCVEIERLGAPPIQSARLMKFLN